MMDIALYELSDSEVATALELTWKVSMEFEVPDYSQEGIDEFRRFLANHVEMEKLRFYGAFSREKIVGVLAMRQSHISLLFVEKEFHRQGIARNLFQYMLSHTPYDSITVTRLLMRRKSMKNWASPPQVPNKSRTKYDIRP